MSSNKKIWFFIESDSEHYFLEDLIKRHFDNNFLIELDILDFVNKSIQDYNKSVIYYENCENVDKVPHQINEMYSQVERSGSRDIFIICDVETKLKCYINRKHCIKSKLEAKIDQNRIKYIFFKPMIESAYWEYPEIIKQIIADEYYSKYKSQISPITIPTITSSFKYNLKKLFQDHKLKYRTTKFAEQFFPQVDYNNCENVVIKRTIQSLQSI